MRKLLILWLIFFAGQVYGQELYGRYSASFIGGESIEFMDNNQFSFSGFYCTWGMKGKGTYKIRDDKLYLYFNKAKKPPEPVKRPAVIEKDSVQNGVTQLNITVLNNKSLEAVPYANIVVSKTSFTIGTSADLEGKAVFKPNSPFPLQLRILALGHEEQKITINEPGKYNITVYLVPKEWAEELINGEVYVYEIGDYADDFIQLKSFNTPAGAVFRIYKKR